MVLHNPNSDFQSGHPESEQKPGNHGGIKHQTHLIIKIIFAKSRVATIAGMQGIHKPRQDENEWYHHTKSKDVVHSAYFGFLLVVLDAAPQNKIGAINEH